MNKAQYTVVLNTLLNDEVTKEQILTKGLGNYPLYESASADEDVRSILPTRESLNKKILNHYKYREIGFETVGRFIDELSITMNEIMPYYNQRLRSVDMMNSIEDIFGNVDVEESTTEVSRGSSESNATNKSENNTDMTDNSKMVHTETPQNQLDITEENINAVQYADDVQWNKNNSHSNANSEGESNVENTSESEITRTYRKKGNQGVNTYAHDIIEFRQTILNVEQEIINDKRLVELFMLVY